MNTDTLIQNLTSQCRPVKPIRHPVSQFLIWLIFSIALLFAGVLYFRSLPDIWGFVSSVSFIFPAAAMLSISVICALSAFLLSVPDDRTARFDIIPITALILWSGLMIYLFAATDLGNSQPGLRCIIRIIGLALLPGALLFYMLKNAAPMRSGLIGLLAALGTLGFAEIAVQMICHKSSITHLLVWHFMPVCLLALLGTVIGHKLFGWNEAEH